jgi:hypothetical protein
MVAIVIITTEVTYGDDDSCSAGHRVGAAVLAGTG